MSSRTTWEKCYSTEHLCNHRPFKTWALEWFWGTAPLVPAVLPIPRWCCGLTVETWSSGSSGRDGAGEAVPVPILCNYPHSAADSLSVTCRQLLPLPRDKWCTEGKEGPELWQWRSSTRTGAALRRGHSAGMAGPARLTESGSKLPSWHHYYTQISEGWEWSHIKSLSRLPKWEQILCCFPLSCGAQHGEELTCTIAQVRQTDNSTSRLWSHPFYKQGNNGLMSQAHLTGWIRHWMTVRNWKCLA